MMSWKSTQSCTKRSGFNRHQGCTVRRKVRIRYLLLCVDNTVRSNHFDETHLHLMPPFTWFLPVSGMNMNRMNMSHQVEFILPASWNVSTQLNLQQVQERDGGRLHSFVAEHRDALLDGIAECNENEIHEFTVGGRQHSLHYWDAGGHAPNEVMLQRFISDMKSIIAEHHALFGPLEEPYHTILHLTDGGRGGLEHTNSHKPRWCLVLRFIQVMLKSTEIL